MLHYDKRSGHIRGDDERGRPLWRAQVAVEDDRGTHVWRADPRGDGLSGKAGPWRVVVEFAPADYGLDLVGLRIAPRGKPTLKRVFLRIPGRSDAVPPLDSPRTRMLLLPDGPFVEKGVVKLGRTRPPLLSRLLTLIYSGGSCPSLLAGLGDVPGDLAFFRVDGKVLEAGFEPMRALAKQEQYRLAFGVSDDPFELLDAYGRLLGGFARPRSGPLTGWNSWDYYGASVTMDDLRREMAAIRTSSLNGRLTHFVIDMGWYHAWGDWRPNRAFPGSLRAIAREIEEAGFVPGIWTAPLQCSIWSQLGRHRQDLFVPGESGAPDLSGGSAVLDWSRPEVLELLHDSFSALRRAGFRYFKIDYIYADAISQLTRRSDQTTGLAGVIRKGLETIREAVGEDSYIMNCGAPVESALGIADGARICTDIHTFWSHIWNNSREIACQLWQNGDLWNIDPDFAVVRSPETSDDPFLNWIHQRRPWAEREKFWMAGSEASFSELKVWLTVVHMCGGDVFLSDSIARLNSKGIAALRKLFPSMRRSARPLDLFENPMPRFWLGRSDRMNRLAVFNWDDRASPIVVPQGLDLPSKGIDIWTGKRVSVSERTTMAPRSAYLLRV